MQLKAGLLWVKQVTVQLHGGQTREPTVAANIADHLYGQNWPFSDQ
jgi:hypothetical protein